MTIHWANRVTWYERITGYRDTEAFLTLVSARGVTPQVFEVRIENNYSAPRAAGEIGRNPGVTVQRLAATDPGAARIEAARVACNSDVLGRAGVQFVEELA